MKYKITMEVEETHLLPRQIELLLAHSLNVTDFCITQESQPSIADLVAAQEQWINEHGGDESGYIDNYGQDRPEYGAAIYAADCGELDRLRCLYSKPIITD
jgi:hypothetical protein